MRRRYKQHREEEHGPNVAAERGSLKERQQAPLTYPSKQKGLGHASISHDAIVLITFIYYTEWNEELVHASNNFIKYTLLTTLLGIESGKDGPNQNGYT